MLGPRLRELSQRRQRGLDGLDPPASVFCACAGVPSKLQQLQHVIGSGEPGSEPGRSKPGGEGSQPRLRPSRTGFSVLQRARDGPGQSFQN